METLGMQRRYQKVVAHESGTRLAIGSTPFLLASRGASLQAPSSKLLAPSYEEASTREAC